MTRYQEIQTAIRKEPRKWLVTGAAGFIGSHLVETLLRLDQEVVGLDNFATGRRCNMEQVEALVGPEAWKRFSLIEGDIRSLETCAEAVSGTSHILHQAALGSVPRSLEDPLTTNAVNVGGHLNMLWAAHQAGIESFVYAASSSTYGDHPDLPKVEDTIGNPLSPYAVTKLVNEHYADVFQRQYGLAATGLRYFNVFGPRQDPDGAYAAVIPKWIQAALDGKQVTINGDGTTSRDFCFIANVVQANLLAAFAPKEARGQVYNVALGDRTSLNDLFSKISTRLTDTGHSSPKVPIKGPFRQGDVLHSQASIQKASSKLGYSPEYRFAQGLDLQSPTPPMRPSSRSLLSLPTVALLASFAFLAACSSPRFHLDDEELQRFLEAGPVTPQFDAQALVASLDARLQYELGSGDLITVELPTAAVSNSPEDSSIGTAILRRRINAQGQIALPVVGELNIIGKTLDEAEAFIALAFHPKFVTAPPAVVVQIVEAQTYPVTVVGTVTAPGRYRLRRNELTLTGALAAAGGISSGNGEFAIGARGVRIYRPGQAAGEEIVLPVRHLNVPTTELALKGGERIEVIRYEPKTFAVLGLVQAPGVFNFPVESDVTLLEAISLARGVDPVGSPPYATVFREDPRTNEILASTFDLRKPLQVATIILRPGDIVHVDHTKGTWTRTFLNNALQLRIGGSFDILE